MAFYDWNAKPLIPHAEIYDANGLEITDVTRCDTKTGQLWRLAKHADGSLEIDPYTGVPYEVIDRLPAPLLVVFEKEPFRG